jgi:hypothetical protein
MRLSIYIVCSRVNKSDASLTWVQMYTWNQHLCSAVLLIPRQEKFKESLPAQRCPALHTWWIWNRNRVSYYVRRSWYLEPPKKSQPALWVIVESLEVGGFGFNLSRWSFSGARTNSWSIGKHRGGLFGEDIHSKKQIKNRFEIRRILCGMGHPDQHQGPPPKPQPRPPYELRNEEFATSNNIRLKVSSNPSSAIGKISMYSRVGFHVRWWRLAGFQITVGWMCSREDKQKSATDRPHFGRLVEWGWL